MNTQEIIENNNELIALFDDCRRDGNKYWKNGLWTTKSFLGYNKEYSKLMPVLTKIQNSGCIIEINYALVVTCRICYLGKNKYDKAINFYGDNNGGKEPIMAIYECVVKFLKFLENEKN